MRATKDRVIVKADKRAEKSAGGIIIAETIEQRDHSGVVAATGPDVKQAKVGDRVVYNTYSEMFKINGVVYRTLKEENCLVILEKGEAAEYAKKNSQGQVSWENLD